MKPKVFLVRFNANGKCCARVAHYNYKDDDNTKISDPLMTFIADQRALDCTGSWVPFPKLLATRWVVWSAMAENLNALQVIDTVVVGDDVYDETADYIFDVHCDRIGSLLGYPDIRCKMKDLGGDYVEVYLNAFSKFLKHYRESETDPLLQIEITR